jgi:hypothetical protein
MVAGSDSGALTDASKRLELDADDQALAVRIRDPEAERQ